MRPTVPFSNITLNPRVCICFFVKTRFTIPVTYLCSKYGFTITRTVSPTLGGPMDTASGNVPVFGTRTIRADLFADCRYW